ncbi:MAG: lipopolysaccharide biosynthesis protein [Bacteroidetes bacterium]|nr:MAG: lipopolysaccharide biosynthesis protein [Bacteroidota bacterium]
MEEKKKKKSMKDNIQMIADLWKYFLARWVIICIFGFGGGAVGLVISILKKPTYEAKLSFVLDSNSISSMAGGLSGLASSFGLGGAASGESIFEGDNFIALLESKPLVEKSLLKRVPHKKITFADYLIEIRELKLQWEDKPHLKNISYPVGQPRSKFTYHQDSVLREIYRDLTKNLMEIKLTSNKVNIINIKIESPSHYFAKTFPGVLIDEASDFYIQTKTAKAKVNYDVLKRQTDSVRAELYNAIAGLASANEQIYGLNPAYMTQRVPAVQKQVDVQANTSILTELVKNLEMARVNLLNKTPLIQVIERPRYPLEEKKLRKLHGVIIGGFLGGILILAILLTIKYIRESLEEPSHA